MKKQNETIILNQIRDYLRLKGWFIIRFQQGLGCHRGLADMIAIKGGRHIFIEVKAPTGKQSEHQKIFECNIMDSGGRYIIARGIEDVSNLEAI